jgi:hypothetical protein
MFKIIVGITLASLCLSLSAKDEDHLVNFEQIKFEASGRNARHVVSTAKEPIESYTYLVGKAKIVNGKSGSALDLSDTRSRTELKLKTAHFYDHNKGTISFWISPKKDKFGVSDEVAIFEETNGDSLFGLYIDKDNRLKLKIKAIFPLDEKKKEVVYDKKFFDKLDNPNPEIKLDSKTVIDKVLDAKEKAEMDAKKKEEDKDKPTFKVKDFNFYSFQRGDTSQWKEGQWNHIAVSYDLRRGFFAVLVNGKYAIRDFASEGKGLGLFLDRGKAGKHIVFGPGNNGFSAAIDEIVISKKVLDVESDMTKR